MGRHWGNGGRRATATLPAEPRARTIKRLQRSTGTRLNVTENAPWEFARTVTDCPVDALTFTRSRLWKCAPSTMTGAAPWRTSDGLGRLAAELPARVRAATMGTKKTPSRRTPPSWHADRLR